MKKITKKEKNNDVQTHIDKAFELINYHLPTSYVSRVRELLPDSLKEVITDSMIRNVRKRIQIPEKQPEILLALIKVAKNNKKFKSDLSTTLNEA